MAKLNELPKELLIQVLDSLPQASLVALIRVDPKLGQVAVPRLYRSLYFWGTGYTDLEERRFPRDVHDDLGAGLHPPRNASRIFNLELLTRSFEESNSLRAYVQELELTWGEEKNAEREAMLRQRHRRLLRYSSDGAQANADTSDDESSKEIKSAGEKSLHLVRLDENRLRNFLLLLDTSSCKNLSLITTDLYARLPEQVSVTSLRLKHRGEQCGDEEILAKDLNRLHQLSCIPSLETLIIDGWRYWGDTVIEVPYKGLENAKTSAISSLQITTTGCPGIDLNEILSWPKALKTFHFDCWPHDGTRYVLPSCPSSVDFIQPLNHCRATIEELIIRVTDNNSETVTNPPISLQRFPELKRLRIRSDFLLMSQYERSLRRKAFEQNEAEPSPNLIDILPPSIEQLFLEIGDRTFEAYDDRGSQGLSGELLDLMDQLEALANSHWTQTQLFPKLKDVVFREASSGSSTFEAFNESRKGAQVRAAFADADIGLRCLEFEESPQTIIPS